MTKSDEHDLGLSHDLDAMRSLDRRHALRMFAGASGFALVGACGGGSSSGAVVTPTPTPTVTPTPSPTPTPTSSVSGCIADPEETAGPYPADGTNQSGGLTSNALVSDGIVRDDIRASFLGGSTTVAQGVQVELTLTLVDANADCVPLAGYAVYLWHCDVDGEYSLYGVPDESYLRGVQTADENGQVTFKTIFPACYSGRYPHMHFEVFSSLANATGGRYAVLTSQLAMPADTCREVYNGNDLYADSISRFSQTSTDRDNVFGDNSSAQIAQQTPSMTGTVADGYVASATVGIAT
ncbi:intradiol ring-cleavage dioxygenase [Stakelama sp. CBK3Z-3]|uniref:Intradiol ring-cleavage dioxygenase n=1 Tax=Stakelama flava TaxID=2860338 RepID=A0ABS6XK29_9SPHN|nr:intradiol ring-cleavage dioxygenase [Stakelama flava]MBW4330560.1 intradiol ring-cleavage dioxygenase [Stakelama flava]